MSYTLLIHVTQEDIDRGERANCSRCPIALAISRVCPGASLKVGGEVHWGEAYESLFREFSPLPALAHRFMGHFDRGLNPPPEQFELAINSKTVDYIARAAGLI